MKMINITPKEKAEELVEKYANIHNNCNNFAYEKACATSAGEEIITAHLFDLAEKQYWHQVKQEIENL